MCGAEFVQYGDRVMINKVNLSLIFYGLVFFGLIIFAYFWSDGGNEE